MEELGRTMCRACRRRWVRWVWTKVNSARTGSLRRVRLWALQSRTGPLATLRPPPPGPHSCRPCAGALLCAVVSRCSRVRLCRANLCVCRRRVGRWLVVYLWCVRYTLYVAARRPPCCAFSLSTTIVRSLCTVLYCRIFLKSKLESCDSFGGFDGWSTMQYGLDAGYL